MDSSRLVHQPSRRCGEQTTFLVIDESPKHIENFQRSIAYSTPNTQQPHAMRRKKIMRQQYLKGGRLLCEDELWCRMGEEDVVILGRRVEEPPTWSAGQFECTLGEDDGEVMIPTEAEVIADATEKRASAIKCFTEEVEEKEGDFFSEDVASHEHDDATQVNSNLFENEDHPFEANPTRVERRRSIREERAEAKKTSRHQSMLAKKQKIYNRMSAQANSAQPEKPTRQRKDPKGKIARRAVCRDRMSDGMFENEMSMYGHAVTITIEGIPPLQSDEEWDSLDEQDSGINKKDNLTSEMCRDDELCNATHDVVCALENCQMQVELQVDATSIILTPLSESQSEETGVFSGIFSRTQDCTPELRSQVMSAVTAVCKYNTWLELIFSEYQSLSSQTASNLAELVGDVFAQLEQFKANEEITQHAKTDCDAVQELLKMANSEGNAVAAQIYAAVKKCRGIQKRGLNKYARKLQSCELTQAMERRLSIFDRHRSEILQQMQSGLTEMRAQEVNRQENLSTQNAKLRHEIIEKINKVNMAQYHTHQLLVQFEALSVGNEAEAGVKFTLAQLQTDVAKLAEALEAIGGGEEDLIVDLERVDSNASFDSIIEMPSTPSSRGSVASSVFEIETL